MEIKVRATTMDAYQLVHDGILALARAERQGIRLDYEYCKIKRKHLERKIEFYQKKIEDTKFYRRWNHIYGAKTNIYSNHQLSKILYKVLKIEPSKTTDTGMGSTDEHTLSQIDIPELKLILQMRKLSKIKETYLGSFMREYNEDGCIHPSFDLHTVRTFRSSGSNPNFQNIPIRDDEAMKICRRAILPRPGHLLMEADFSALEVNVSQFYHKDPVMKKYLLDKDSDMHLDMAKQIFMLDEMDRSLPAHKTLRNAAKNGFIFPQFYGDYYGNNAKSLADWATLPQEGRWKKGSGIQLPDGTHISDHFRGKGITSFNSFLDHLQAVENDFWNRRFRKYHEWRKSQVARYRKKGYLKMLTGFECSGVMRRNEIINYPIQGTAFHCLLFTFIRLDEIMRQEKWDTKLIGQIHDSIIMDVDPDELDHVQETAHRIVREDLPAKWNWIIIPLEIEIDVYGIDKPWIR